MKRRGFIKSIIGGVIGLLTGKIAICKTQEPEIDVTKGFVSKRGAIEEEASMLEAISNEELEIDWMQCLAKPEEDNE